MTAINLPQAVQGLGEIYVNQRTNGNVGQTANAETTVVSLGAKQYYAGRKYEIRATIWLQASVANIRALSRIYNVEDGDRANIVDSTTAVSTSGMTAFQSVYRYSPLVDAIREFRITFQNANATGTLTASGTAPNASLISAVDVGPQ